jgi:hypothetical protein
MQQPQDGSRRQRRRVALRLLAASRDALLERRFEGDSRLRKEGIALDAAALLHQSHPEISAHLSALAAKLRQTDCWGARPRAGLSEAFSQAALLLHPGVERDFEIMIRLSQRTSSDVPGKDVRFMDDVIYDGYAGPG